MGFSPLADMSRRIPDGGRRNNRTSKIVGFTIHHNAGVNAYGEATNPNRQVSANYWITNDGVIIPNVDEIYRAWTTGHASYPEGAKSDHRNITVEVSNSPEGVKSKSWVISPEAERSLIALIADCAKRHGFPIVRGTASGIAVHRDFVATECPGGYIMGRLESIIAAAKGTTPAPAPTPSPAPSRSIADMAAEVIAGKHGNGHENRRRSLGVTAAVYEQVRAEVNRRVSGAAKPAAKTVSQMATEVIQGKHGNGHENRRRSLGVTQAVYAQVRAEVNRRVG